LFPKSDMNAQQHPAGSRRDFLRRSLVVAAGGPSALAFAAETVQLPFENGGRPLVKYPQKRP